MCLPVPKATSQILPGKVTRLTIPLPTNPLARYLWKTWSPGSHIRVTIPTIGLLQPHPFTIASLPSDKEIRLYIRSRGGFSQLLYEKTAGSIVAGQQLSLKINFEGIYGAKFPSFAKFDVVLLISSGIGITFCITILKDIVQKMKEIQARDGICRCKRIGFVWVVKHRGPLPLLPSRKLMSVELTWFAKELSEIMEQAFGLVALRLYVTQDEPPPPGTPINEKEDGIPSNVVPFLRSGRPNLTGLVEQAVDEAVNMGRLGVATCASRGVNIEVKDACRKNLSKDMQGIYCHAEEFDY
jgi:ferric-chelate reductase